MKDKIIQLINAVESSYDYQAFGLSESGKMYILQWEVVEKENKKVRQYYWALIVDSPDTE